MTDVRTIFKVGVALTLVALAVKLLGGDDTVEVEVDGAYPTHFSVAAGSRDRLRRAVHVRRRHAERRGAFVAGVRPRFFEVKDVTGRQAELVGDAHDATEQTSQDGPPAETDRGRRS